MKKAVLYMRMSTDKQDGSIPAQRNVLIDYATKNGYKVLEEYKDEGISGRNAEKRPAFLQMIDDSVNGVFDTVLIYDSSRFARNLEESLVYKSALKKNGVTVVSATEPTLDEDTGLITDALLGAMNELYSRKLSKQVLRGMTETAKKGYCQTKPPFGYKATDKRGVFVPCPDTANIAKEMFELYASHTLSLNGIARYVNANYGLRYEGKSIKYILKSEFYIGNVTWNGITAKGIHEPIIDVDTFTKANERYQKITFKRDPSSNKHWLSGIIKCGYCGRSMTFANSNWPVFQCNKKSAGLCSRNNRIRSYKAENMVMELLKMLYDNKITVSLEQIVKRNVDNGEEHRLKAAIKKLEIKLDRAKQLYLDGIDDIDEYKETKTSITKDIALLSDNLKALDTEPIDSHRTKNRLLSRSQIAIDLLSDPKYSNAQKNEALRTIFDRIEYKQNTDEFFIFYSL